MNKQDAAKVIALTLAELHGNSTPTIVEWHRAKVLADRFAPGLGFVEEPRQYAKGDRVSHDKAGAATVHQDQGGFHYVYIEADNDPGIAVSVDPSALRLISEQEGK